MKKIIIILIFYPLITFTQNSYNLSLIGSYEWPTTEGSDIWGWSNNSNGNEYALVCLNDGFSCVNITDPSNPYEEFYISDLNSIWRDVKTWGNYAYITTEAYAGLLIVDLTDMTGNTYWHKSEFINLSSGNAVNFSAAHNLYIDENGICYIFGASDNNGGNPSDGAIFLDLSNSPTDPEYIGSWDDEYVHDGMVKGDTMYASCINNGNLYIINVIDKTNPVILATQSTPNLFTHNAWISNNGKYIFTTDEKSDAYIASYDITDLSNIQEIDRIQSNPESNSIPHNTHFFGDFLFTSWYRDGTIVHDVSNPNNMIQVAYYDSYLGSGDGFDGCWGTYPFLPSGLIISSDINSGNNGKGRLLIFQKDFGNACILEGNVTDAISSQDIIGAEVSILNTVIPNSTTTNLDGNYYSGNADSGLYNVVFNKSGYISDTLQASLTNGQVTILNTSLYAPIIGCMDSSANNYNPNANTTIAFGGEIDTSFSSGSFSNGNHHLIFDALTNLIITSAMFYVKDTNTITFELRDSIGLVIDDTTHLLFPGHQQLVLNFNVPIGNDMQLGISNGNTSLYRNNSGASFPYNIGNAMNITGASNLNIQDNYYYYYNIEVETACTYSTEIKWNCDSLGNCFQSLNQNGQFNSLSQCELNCINTENNNEIFSDQKKVIKITDLLGKNYPSSNNNTKVLIYDDGSFEKKIIID